MIRKGALTNLGTVLHSTGEKYIQDSLHIVSDIFLNNFFKMYGLAWWHTPLILRINTQDAEAS